MFECSQSQLTGNNMLQSQEYTPTTDSELMTPLAQAQSVPSIEVVRLHFGGDEASGKWRTTDMPKDLRRVATKHRPADRLDAGHCQLIARSVSALRRLKLEKLSPQRNLASDNKCGLEENMESTRIQRGETGLDDSASDQLLSSEAQPIDRVTADGDHEQAQITNPEEQQHINIQETPDMQKCADIQECRANELSPKDDQLTGLNNTTNYRKRKVYQSLPKVVYSWRPKLTKLRRSDGVDEDAAGRRMRRVLHWTGTSHFHRHISIRQRVELEKSVDRISFVTSASSDGELQRAADELTSNENKGIDNIVNTAVIALLPSIDIDRAMSPDCAPITFALHTDLRSSEADDNARCATDTILSITGEPDAQQLALRARQDTWEHCVCFQQPESDQRVGADDSSTSLVGHSTILNTDGVEERGLTMTNSQQSPSRAQADDELVAAALDKVNPDVNEDTEELHPSLVGQQAPDETELNGVVFSHSDFPTTINGGYADWQEIEQYINENFANDCSSDESDDKLVVDVSHTPVDEHHPIDTGRLERVSKRMRRRHRRQIRTRVTRRPKSAEKRRNEPQTTTMTNKRHPRRTNGKRITGNRAHKEDTTERGPKAKIRSRKLKAHEVIEALTAMSEDDRAHRVRQRNPSLKGAEYISMEFDAAHRAAERRKKPKKQSNGKGREKEWKIGKRLMLPTPPKKKTRKRTIAKHNSTRDELLTRSRTREKNRNTINLKSENSPKWDIKDASSYKVETGDDAASDAMSEQSQWKKHGKKTESDEERIKEVNIIINDDDDDETSHPAVNDLEHQTATGDIQMDTGEQPEHKQMRDITQPAADNSVKDDEVKHVDEESAEALIQLSNKINKAVVKEKSAGGSKSRHKHRRSDGSSAGDSLAHQVLALELGPRFNWLEHKINTMQTDGKVGWPATSSCQPSSSSTSTGQSSKPSSASSLVPSSEQQSADDRHLATDDSTTRTEQAELVDHADMTANLCSEPAVPVDFTQHSHRQTLATVEYNSKDQVSTSTLPLTTMTSQPMDTSSASSLTTRTDQQTTEIEASTSALAIVRPLRVVHPKHDVSSELTVSDGDVIRHAAVEAGACQKQSAESDDGLRLSTTGNSMTSRDADDTLKTEYARRYEMYKDLCRLSQMKDEEVAMVDAERERLRQELVQMQNMIRLKHVPQTSRDNQVHADYMTAFRCNGPAHGHMSTATVVAHADRPPAAHERKVNLTMYSTLVCNYRHPDVEQRAIQEHCADDVIDMTRTSQKVVAVVTCRLPETSPYMETVSYPASSCTSFNQSWSGKPVRDTDRTVDLSVPQKPIRTTIVSPPHDSRTTSQQGDHVPSTPGPHMVQQHCQGSPRASTIAVESGRGNFLGPNRPSALLNRQEPAIKQPSHFPDARSGPRCSEPVVLRSPPGDVGGVTLDGVGPVDTATHNTALHPPRLYARPPPEYPGPRGVPRGPHPGNNCRQVTPPADGRNHTATGTGRVQSYDRIIDCINPPTDPAAGGKTMIVDDVTMVGYTGARDANTQVQSGVRTASLPVPNPENFVAHRVVRPDAMFSRPCLPDPNDGQFHHRQHQHQQQPSHPSASQYQQLQQPKLSPHHQSAMPPQYYTASERSALRAQGPPEVPELRGMRPGLPGNYPPRPQKPSQPSVKTQLLGPAYHDRIPAAGQRHRLRPVMAHTSVPEDILRRSNVQISAAPPTSALSRHSGAGIPVAGFPGTHPLRVPYENKQPVEQHAAPAGSQSAGSGAHPPGPDRDDARPPFEFRCETCGRPALFVCGACKSVPYCSDVCQATSWRLHHGRVCNTRH